MKTILLTFIALITFSCSNGVQNEELLLDRIVQLEDQVQKINIVQADRGSIFFADIHSEYIATPQNDEMKSKTSGLAYILQKMENINSETNSLISTIEAYKIALLKNAGENTKKVHNLDASTIVWKEYDEKDNAFIPARMNLSAVKDKNNTSVATAYFVDADGINPNAKGLELWSKLNEYRSNMVQLVGEYSWGKSTFEFDPIDINSFSSKRDLMIKVKSMIEKSNANKKEDANALKELYIILTKLEKVAYHGTEVHWISASFNDATLISAIAALTSLEQDILSARAYAMAHWASKINICGYGFDKIIPLATGPSTAFEGDEVKINVLMAAFDSYNQPSISTTNVSSTLEYIEDGIGTVSITPKKGLQTIKGTVSIRNKSGVLKTENWEWTINVLPK